MILPTPYALPHRRLVEGARDAHNNPRKAWEEDPDPLVAHAIQGPLAELQDVLRDDATTHDKVVLAPKWVTREGERLEQSVAVGDELLDEDDWYDVVGVTDWTRGPWKHPTAGLEIKMKKVKG